MDKVEAVEKTVKMWEWLAADSGRNKWKYFGEFGITDRPKRDDCYLCEAFGQIGHRGEACFDCPLYEAGEHCFRNGSAFRNWAESISKARSDSAQRIVDVCKRWLKEHYNPSIKGTRHMKRYRVFEETGEFRLVKKGEWFVGDSNGEERKDWSSVLQGSKSYAVLGKRVIVEEVFPEPLYKAVMVEGGKFFSLNSWVWGCKEVEYVVGGIVTVGEDTMGVFCYETEEEAVRAAMDANDILNRRSIQWAVLEVIPLVKSGYKWGNCNPLSVKVVGVAERSVEEPVWEELGGKDLHASVSGGSTSIMINLYHGKKLVAQIPFNGDEWHVMTVEYRVKRSDSAFVNNNGTPATFFKVLHRVK